MSFVLNKLSHSGLNVVSLVYSHHTSGEKSHLYLRIMVYAAMTSITTFYSLYDAVDNKIENPEIMAATRLYDPSGIEYYILTSYVNACIVYCYSKIFNKDLETRLQIWPGGGPLFERSFCRACSGPAFTFDNLDP